MTSSPHAVFSDSIGDVGAPVALDSGECRYLIQVVRVRTGETIRVLDGCGESGDAVVRLVSNRQVELELVARHPHCFRESPVALTLYQGVAKSQQMDLICQKATELGVSRIVPVFCERNAERKRAGERVERWQRVVKEAVRQCGRSVVPTISPLQPIEEIQSPKADGFGWVFWESHEGQPDEPLSIGTEGALIVGPEGGLTSEEVQRLVDLGFRALSLGPRILRVETAAITAMALAQSLAGDLFSYRRHWTRPSQVSGDR